MRLSLPQAIIEYERKMIEKQLEQTWFSKSGDRSICPDKKWVDNLWARLRLVNKGTLSGPDSYLRAVQWVKEYNNKHGDKFASVNRFKGTADHAELCANPDENHTCTNFSQPFFCRYLSF